MKHLDLKGLVLPYIGIDEFKPKTGTEREVIVVNFMCNDELPAVDLMRFLEMSAAEILDSDMSEMPDDNDRYPVFIEFKRDKKFWEKFRTILRDVESTTGKMKWRVSVYRDDNLYSLSDPELITKVVVNKKVYDRKFMKTNDYDAELANIEKNEDLQIEAYRGKAETIIEAFELDNQPSTLVKDYTNRIINDFTSLPTHRIGNYYVSEQGGDIILFKVKS